MKNFNFLSYFPPHLKIYIPSHPTPKSNQLNHFIHNRRILCSSSLTPLNPNSNKLNPFLRGRRTQNFVFLLTPSPNHINQTISLTVKESKLKSNPTKEDESFKEESDDDKCC